MSTTPTDLLDRLGQEYDISWLGLASGPQNAGEHWDEREQAGIQVTEDQVDVVVYRQHPGEVWQGTGTGGSENGRWRCVVEKWLKTVHRQVFDCPPILKQKSKTHAFVKISS